jgi:hypothetical protein
MKGDGIAKGPGNKNNDITIKANDDFERGKAT